MSTIPDQRTTDLLVNLDNSLSAYPNGPMSHRQIINTFRWIVQNLDRTALFNFMDRLALANGDAIRSLVADSYFQAH